MNIYAKLLGFWAIVLIWSMVRLSAQDAQVLKYIPGYNGGAEIKPYGEQIINRTIVGLHQSKAVDVVSPTTTSPRPVTHLLEIMPAFYMYGKMVVSKAMDSIQTMTFEYVVEVGARAELLITDVATGEILKTHTIAAIKTEAQKFNLKYYQIRWQSNQALNDSIKWHLCQEALNRLQATEQTKPLEQKAIENVLGKLAEEAALAPFHVFHFRVQVKDMEIAASDGSVTALASSGLEQHGVPPNLHLNAFSIEEKTYGSMTFERPSSYGNFRYSGKNDQNEFSAPVEKGGQALANAFKAGKTVWISPFAPYTELKEKAEAPTIALVLLAPKITPAQMEMAYFSLRRDFLTTQGPGYHILDRSKFDLILKEKEAQKSEVFLDQKSIAQFKSVGARYILEVKFGHTSIGETQFHQTYVMRLIDVETSEVLAEVTSNHYDQWNPPFRSVFEKGQYIHRYCGTPNMGFVSKELWYAAMKYNFREVLNRGLPPLIVVDRIWDEKKDRAKELLIMGNFNSGLKNDQFYICRKKQVEVNGEQMLRMEQIGTCAIEYAKGKGVAVVTVRKGEKDVYQAMKASEALFCTDKADWYADKFYSGQLKKAGF